MPALALLATAYDAGQAFRGAFRWMLLLIVGLTLAVRVARMWFGHGHSPLGIAVNVVAVVVGLFGCLHYNVVGYASGAPGADMTAARQEVMLGCLDQNQPRNVCECYGDEVLRRIDRSQERFAALERDMVRRQNAGQGPPALLVEAAQACAGHPG
jgi:hypothetical protein